MTTMDQTFTSLQQAARDIRSTARSMSDLRKWLEEHIEVLTYGVHIPEDADVEVRVNGDWRGLLSSAAQTKALLVMVDTKAHTRFEAHPGLTGYIDVTTSRRRTIYNHECTLHLSLEEWPLATLVVAAKYLSPVQDEFSEQAKVALRSHLDECLSKHSPAMTIALLEGYACAGLLTKPHSELIDLELLAEMLFSVRQLGSVVTLPECDI